MECPGETHHTTRLKISDCKIYLNHVPTVFCFHNSCREEVLQKTREVRVALADLYREEGLQPPWLDKDRRFRKLQVSNVNELEQMAEDARGALPDILKENPWNLPEAYHEAKSRLINGRSWQQHLSLFSPSDLVWIGDLHNTGLGEGHHFRLAREWMNLPEPPFGRFICPSAFKYKLRDGHIIDKTTFRRNASVEARRFLVLESDTLSKAESCAVYRWCSDFMKLRALVLSGNKSIHAWFDLPRPRVLEALTYMLPSFQMDRQLITTPSQPGRFAGAWREPGKRQHLIWFDKPSPGWERHAPFLFNEA